MDDIITIILTMLADTAKKFGRLSLNPIKHLDPIGTLCMIFFHVGWAKPVPINARCFKNPKRDFAICAVMGPVANLMLAILSAPLYLLLLKSFSQAAFESDFLFNLVLNTVRFILIFHTVNIGLCIFNLLPIPPLDGSRLASALLPNKVYYKIMEHERTIYFVFLGWLILGDAASTFLRSMPFFEGNAVVAVIATIISLPDLLGFAISAISNLIMDFWALIPFFKI